MNKETYSLLENYMLTCMEDSAHDKEHVYRVLYNALEIAKSEDGVDYDVLIASCLLHDIGRKEQFENPSLCHAIVGSKKAYDFLIEHGFEIGFAERVKHCIQTHRYRNNNQPQSLEAKILFDADKLDVAGAMGIARTLIYKGIVSEPLYSVLPDGKVSDGENDTAPSFFQEYKYKLENLYTNFYTKKAAEIAKERQRIAVDFYNCLYQEANSAYQNRITLEDVVAGTVKKV
ncbi:MAG: HD domain-containing protein [Lachnospiraceae bacterium]|nr:HD domain-containing protein [Lachnospiraceae bacterium]